jgi:hypothetical protein
MAEDNLLVREGVRTILVEADDLDLQAVCADAGSCGPRSRPTTPTWWSPTSTCRRCSPTTGSWWPGS